MTADGGSLSSVLYFTPGRSGFQMRRARASAAAMRVDSGDQERVRMTEPDEGGLRGGKRVEVAREGREGTGAVESVKRVDFADERARGKRAGGMWRGAWDVEGGGFEMGVVWVAVADGMVGVVLMVWFCFVLFVCWCVTLR